MKHEIKPGEIYTHWKKPENKYRIVGIGLSQMDSYDLQPMVIYEPLFETPEIDTKYWVRPLEDFVGEVEYSDATKGPRFVQNKNNPL